MIDNINKKKIFGSVIKVIVGILIYLIELQMQFKYGFRALLVGASGVPRFVIKTAVFSLLPC